jgi:periodic tryptophan protein 1
MWDVSEAKADCVAGKAMAVGEIYAAAFNPDTPFTVAAAGSNGKTAIWEADENADVARVFKGRALAFSSEYGGLEAPADGAPASAAGSRQPKQEGVDNEVDMILAEEPMEDGEGDEADAFIPPGSGSGGAGGGDEQETKKKKKKKKKGKK